MTVHDDGTLTDRYNGVLLLVAVAGPAGAQGPAEERTTSSEARD